LRLNLQEYSTGQAITWNVGEGGSGDGGLQDDDYKQIITPESDD